MVSGPERDVPTLNSSGTNFSGLATKVHSKEIGFPLPQYGSTSEKWSANLESACTLCRDAIEDSNLAKRDECSRVVAHYYCNTPKVSTVRTAVAGASGRSVVAWYCSFVLVIQYDIVRTQKKNTIARYHGFSGTNFIAAFVKRSRMMRHLLFTPILFSSGYENAFSKKKMF